LLSVPYALYAQTAGTIDNSGGSAGQGFNHYIGEYFGGGIIFHLWKDSSGSEHGLIVDLIEISAAHIWSNLDNTEVGPAAQSTWDGLNNSISIVSQLGHTVSAAALCLDSTNGGYDDWYLPSIDELSLIWHNRFHVNKALSAIPGALTFANTAGNGPMGFFSSSEFRDYSVWGFNFLNGDTFTWSKEDEMHVRAIRSF
jgi:hypothetical protein